MKHPNRVFLNRTKRAKMAIEFQCPACRSVLRVPDDAANQKGRCPTCQQKIRVPKVPPSAAPGRPEAAAIEFRCPRCAAVIRSPAEAAGQKGQCPQCQGRIRVPDTLPPAASAPSASSAAVPQAPANEAAYFGLGAIAAAVENEPFSVGVRTGDDSVATSSVDKPLAQKAPAGKPPSIGTIVTSVILAGLVAVGVYLSLRPHKPLTGTLKGVLLTQPELPPMPADPGVFGEYAVPISKLQACLETYPIKIASELMTAEVTVSEDKLLVAVTPGDGMATYRVDVEADGGLREYLKDRLKDLDRPRVKVLSKSSVEFLQAAGRRCGKKDPSSEGFAQYRNPVALAACVGGLGYNVQAAARGEAYPCVRESGSSLYFVLPQGLKTFELVGRDVPGSSVKFEGTFTVEVIAEPPPKPKRGKKN